MKWNKMDIHIDFDRFWDNYYLILINSTKENEKYYDSEDFQTWLMLSNDIISCPVKSILHFSFEESKFVWGLVLKSEKDKLNKAINNDTRDKFLITSIYRHDAFCNRVSDKNAQKRIITQLFLNYVEKDALWSNLSGKCLVDISSEVSGLNKSKQHVFLEFKLDKNLFLSINVRTATISFLAEKKPKLLKRPPYLFDEKRDNRFRRAFKEFDEISFDNTYRFFGFRNKKNTFPFLSFKVSKKSKYACKLKYLLQLMNRLNNSDFCTLGILDYKFEELNGEVLNLRGQKDTFKLKDKNFKEFQLWLDDDCENAEEFFREWQKKNSIKYKTYRKTDEIDQHKPTIMIVHDEIYYSDRKIEDTYKTQSPISPFIQHIQLETLIESEKNANDIINKSLDELTLKISVADKQMPIQPPRKGTFPELTFCIPYNEIIRDSKTNDSISNIRKFASCSLSSDGKIEYSLLDPYSNMGNKLLYLDSIYKDAPEWKGVANISCFIWKNTCAENIYSIIELQNAFQLPFYEKIFQYFKYSTKKDIALDKSIIINMLKKFYTDFSINSIESKNYIKELEESPDRFLLPSKIKIKKEHHADFFFWKDNPLNPYNSVPISVPWRNREVFPAFGLPLKMGYTKAKLPFIEGNTRPCILYYTGCRPEHGSATGLHDMKASTFRALISMDTTDYSIWDSIYPLMDVDFITLIPAFTVLPFPVKLLREYVNLETKKQSQMDCYQIELNFDDSCLNES